MRIDEHPDAAAAPAPAESGSVVVDGARHRSYARGFTLMEMAIVLAIMGIVAITATSLFSLYTNIMKKSRLETQLRQRSELALEYLVNEARRAGGQGAPPAASVFVENDCGPRAGFPACDNSDRVTITQPLVGYSRCKVERDTGGFVDVKLVRPRAGFAPECCLRSSPSFARQIAFVKDDVVVPAFLTRGSGSCNFRYIPLANAPPGDLRDSLIVMSDVKTFYREPGTGPDDAGRLVMHLELHGDPDIVGERLYLANNIVDFQVRQSGPGNQFLGLSVVAGEPHAAGTLDVSTAFDTTRTIARRMIVREATARIALRDVR